MKNLHKHAKRRGINPFRGFAKWYEYSLGNGEYRINMLSATQEYSSPEVRSVIFFRNVKRALGISSTKRLVAIVGRVLGHLCRSMTTQQVASFVNRLPVILQSLLMREQTGTNNRQTYSHLDELVESMYEEDRKSDRPMFSTEVQALNAVVIVLRKLDKYLNIFSYNVLRPQWVEGLKQIPMEDVY